MSFEFSAFGFISLLVSANSMLVGVALIARAKKGRSQVRTRFALLLVIIGYLLATFTLIYYDVIHYTGIFRLSHDLTALLLGACILDYVRYSIHLNSLKVLNIVPAATYGIAFLFFGEPFYNRVHIVHLDCVGFAYSVLAMLTYIRYLRHQFLAGKNIERKLNVELVLAIILSIYLIQFSYLFNNERSILLIAAPFLAAVFAGLFYSLFIFSPKTANFFFESSAQTVSRVKSKDLESISDAVASKELYLDPTLSVGRLASSLGYKARDLSKIVNTETGSSFYEFINGFRVEKAKSLLRSPQESRTSIEAIALLCGFKSRSAFYESFRRVTGKSPGDYRAACSK